jgi:hypothetical protein
MIDQSSLPHQSPLFLELSEVMYECIPDIIISSVNSTSNTTPTAT